MNKKEVAAERNAHASAVNKKTQFNYLSSNPNHQGKFNKRSLPSPLDVLNLLGISGRKMNPRGYWVLHCPFHKSGREIHPSLNLHSITGHYLCHACGVKGGDILDFYRKFTGKNFVEAAKDLGILKAKA